MKLSKLCEEFAYTCLQGSMELEVTDIVYDSRKVRKGTVFVCIVGTVTDGHDYIESALEQGAAAFVVEHEIEVRLPEACTVIQVASARKALAHMSAVYFDHPARSLITIGLTGTKGKTTTTYMIKSVLETAGRKVGLIGTIGALIGAERLEAKNTTPESYELHRMFRAMVDAGCQYVVMEVSSQGLKMDRVAGITFDYGIYTNLSPDHIGPGEHDNFEEYMECKSLLFRQCRIGIVNIDDGHAEDVLRGHTCEVKTFSCGKDADLMAGAIGFLDEDGQIGMHFTTTGCMDVYAVVHIPGRFSVYNSLVTMLTCHLEGISDAAILKGLDRVKVRGRVELVPVSKDFTVIIDYAHNEVSTRSVLTTLKEYHPKRLICVYGGGGNRSKLRRYDMGEVTGELADLNVLTCDNPRDEEIQDINNDIKIGLAKSNGKYMEIEDRKEAIKYCIEHARKGDMIVLLGKGHEDYQEIKGVKYHFDEREAIAEIKEELGIL
ncbi:MAG: UDP-N-acetylmuramoyl-L-alanyl-D-glutamate--2,6-diaminopimelate ligase [Lachnospiraceae bacterium]|nr:UDP-N-acetylmuramoyl-L-alanyl-D-glutamate--2,6-diaminopimelate ligase [Lachnospiraceae bacterium]